VARKAPSKPKAESKQPAKPAPKPKAKASAKAKEAAPKPNHALALHDANAPAWHREAGEGERAYAAFCYYYGLPPQQRSVDAAYKAHWHDDQAAKAAREEVKRRQAEEDARQANKRLSGKTGSGKTGAKQEQKTPAPIRHKEPPKRAAGHWFEWCSTWRWVERAIKHDQHQAELRAKRSFDRAFKRLEKQQLDIEAAQQIGANWLYTIITDKRFKDLDYEKKVTFALLYMRQMPSLQQAEREVMGVIQTVLNQQAKIIITNEQQQ
jgi:hypothetical protein